MERTTDDYGEEDSLTPPMHARADSAVSTASASSSIPPPTPTYVQLPTSLASATSNFQPPVMQVASSNGETMTIDPDVFDALPPEIQHEILMAQRAASTSSLDQERSELEEDHRFSTADSQEEKTPTATPERPSSAPRRAQDGWICHVCTFANHPELLECEMCETMCIQDAADLDEYDRYMLEAMRYARRSSSDASTASTASTSRSRANSSNPVPNELYQRISKRLGQARLKNLKVPATPATTSLTMKDDPTAEDLLLAATAKLQHFQSTASKRLLKAKQTILTKANAVSNGSSRSKASSLVIEPSLPSDHAAMELCLLQQDLNRKCQADDEVYEALLQRLWNAVYQDVPVELLARSGFEKRAFERLSTAWIDLGFQGENPDTDFRGGGLLALKCLVYACEAYPQKMLEILSAQKPSNDKKWYPVAVAGINLTCIMAGLLQLGDGKFQTTPTTYWKLFEEPAAFYQLFFLALVKMDAAWRRMNASFMEFNVVLKATRKMVVYMLDQAPQSLAELRDASERTFIDRYVVSMTSSFLADSENGECPDPYNVLEDENEILLTAR